MTQAWSCKGQRRFSKNVPELERQRSGRGRQAKQHDERHCLLFSGCLFLRTLVGHRRLSSLGRPSVSNRRISLSPPSFHVTDCQRSESSRAVFGDLLDQVPRFPAHHILVYCAANLFYLSGTVPFAFLFLKLPAGDELNLEHVGIF